MIKNLHAEILRNLSSDQVLVGVISLVEGNHVGSHDLVHREEGLALNTSGPH